MLSADQVGSCIFARFSVPDQSNRQFKCQRLGNHFFNDTATTEIYTLSYTLSLHDALPIESREARPEHEGQEDCAAGA
eukprot:SAG22_NODE_16830_length_317_cov_0.449541_1_plen_77_part_10